MKEVVTVITTTINFSKETSSAFMIFECINTVLVSFCQYCYILICMLIYCWS